MRIERIDWIGDDAVAGRFDFPSQGVALWPAGHAVREDALLQTVATALWGPSPDAPLPAGLTRVAVALRLDDGTALAFERSLDDGALQISGDDPDRFDPVGDQREPGERLLDLSRADFVRIAHTDLEGLRGTRGDLRFRELLSDGRRPAAPVAEPASPAAPAPRATEPDLAIVHAGIEETWPATKPDDAAPAPPAARDEEADASPAAEARRVRRRIAEIDLDLKTLDHQLHDLSERREDLRRDGERFGLLTGTEPADVERLVELTDELTLAVRRRDDARQAREDCERELASRGLDRETLAELRKRFASLEPQDREFLEGAEQLATIRRGNLTLARSECRLAETRLEEIEQARTAGTRASLPPLIGAAVGLFGSLATLLTGHGGIVSALLLLGGIGAGGFAAWITWRARTLRESERLEILRALEEKRAQLAGLEDEGTAHDRRGKTLAARLRAASLAELRRDFRRWLETGPAQQDLDALAASEAAADDNIVLLRGRLSAFRIDDVGGEPDLAALAELIEDYQRHFHARRELAAAEDESARLEVGLTDLEAQRAEATASFEALLTAAGIDPDRDPDEAVEMLALRARYSPRADADDATATATDADGTVAEDVKDAEDAAVDAGAPAEVPADPEPAVSLPDGAELVVAGEDRSFDTSWRPAVSAAMEATLRRFLPEARDVDVDGELEPSLRLDARGPRLDAASLERLLSAAAMDQVWLALRLAIVETLAADGERIPLFLDDPWTRADDSRHARGLEWCLDAGARGQVVFRTSHEVRVKWFLHQHPGHRPRITSILPAPAAPAPSPAAATSAPAAPAPLSSLSPRR